MVNLSGWDHSHGKLAVLDLVSHPTRHWFFTGKGGVGKTTVAAALALGLAQPPVDVEALGGLAASAGLVSNPD